MSNLIVFNPFTDPFLVKVEQNSNSIKHPIQCQSQYIDSDGIPPTALNSYSESAWTRAGTEITSLSHEVHSLSPRGRRAGYSHQVFMSSWILLLCAALYKFLCEKWGSLNAIAVKVALHLYACTGKTLNTDV